MRYFILITGASSGIGEHACALLIRNGYEILAGVRTHEAAAKLTSAYKSKVHPLIMDVTDHKSMTAAVQSVDAILNGGSLVAIINNAGIVVSGASLYIPMKEWENQFNVNVLGVIRTTQLFFPVLARKKPDGDPHPRRIINISSISGLFASPFLAPYSASKFAVEALSDSLRRELFMYDIQVVLLEPGNMHTPIWEKANTAPSYLGPEYHSLEEFRKRIIEGSMTHGISLSKLDATLLRVIRKKQVRARYLIKPQKWKFRLMQCMPTRWIDWLIRKTLQKKAGIRPY